MTVLITGATGFIGSRLAQRCLESGEKVRALGLARGSVEAERASALEQRGASLVLASVTEAGALPSACAGVETVYHLAAAQHEANVPDQHFRDVNVDGTRNLLAASVAEGVRRFVHGSSIGVYGFDASGTVRDDSALEPDNIYGVTKLAGEQAVREVQGAIEWVIVRISEVYGPGDLRLLKLFRGVRRGRFPLIGRGDNLHHLIFIDDLLDGLLAAAQQPSAVGATFVLAGPRPVSTREMLDGVAHVLGVRPPRLRIPLGPALLVARIAEAVLRPLGIQPPLHPRRMNFYRKSFSFSMDGARGQLGFRPRVGFEEGIAATARWYRERGLLT